MKVCVLGSGGREHALVWKLRKSSNVSKIFAIPGNGGTETIAKNVDLTLNPPFSELKEFIKKTHIELVIIGPEQPLADGIVDILSKDDIKVFGPSSDGAMIESSKAFAKLIMKKNNVPTADFELFDNFEDSKKFFEKHSDYVIKVNGLASGKGVLVPATFEEGIKFLKEIFVDKKFGNSGDKVIIEKRIEGYEISVFVITDGEEIKFLSAAQDYKRAFDNDQGPNTGGMGAYTPVPFLSKDMIHDIMKKIVYRTIEGLGKENIIYKGILYCGLIVDKNGNPFVLEFNCRFGDPEAQVTLPLMRTDFYEVAQATTESLLRKINLEMYPKFATTVVLASKGYPEFYEKHKEITGDLSENDNSIVLHAGTITKDRKLLTNGGRVLNVVGIGSSLKEATSIAYQRINNISFEGMFYRKDIGQKAIK